jgi:hypothetical protein
MPTKPILFQSTGRQSDKVFCLPNRAPEAASKIGELATNVRARARNVHITPGIAESSLISIVKFAEAGYTTIFTGNQVNIYDQHNTVITVLQVAIICSWCEPNGLYRIPIIPVVHNNNTDTVLVKQPPSKFLPACPPPEEAVVNVYELKTQPELVQYIHAPAGFPTKPTWYNAVKNKQFVSWPDLTPEAVARHFPNSKKTIKGHPQKAKSGQRLNKCKPSWDDNLVSEHIPATVTSPQKAPRALPESSQRAPRELPESSHLETLVKYLS